MRREEQEQDTNETLKLHTENYIYILQLKKNVWMDKNQWSIEHGAHWLRNIILVSNSIH